MLRKRNPGGNSSTDTVEEEPEEHGDGMAYGLTDYGEVDGEGDGDTVYEDDYDESEYSESAEGDYDETAYAEDGDEYYDEDEETEEEDFTPPTAAAAVKRSWMSSRSKAQPASGTAEDAQRVNFVNKRERIIGAFLGVMLIALAIASYFVDRHLVYTKNIKLQNQVRSEAPWVLLVTLGLAVLILAATYFRRRAALGFTLLLAGVALFNGDFFIGIIYLGTGLWLVFRSMKRTPRAAAGARGAPASRATGRAGASASATTASASSSSRATSSSSTARPASGRQIGRNGRISASSAASGRYTPPKPMRHVPPAVQPEAEPSNRLSAWLKK